MVTEEQQIAALFCITAAYYGRPLTDSVALLYAQDLSDLSVAQVKAALVRMRRDPRRRTCPLPAEVREVATADPNAPTAEQIAARIAGAMRDFGQYRSADARARVGPVGWQAVQDLGGWASICRRVNASEIGVFQAQAREVCRAYLDQAYAAEAARPALAAAPQQPRLAGLTAQIGAW